MNPSELKIHLETLGWRLEPLSEHTGVDWYAYRRLDGVADCTSNEKPPSLIIKPWEIVGSDQTWRSVEFCVAGEVGAMSG